MILTDREIKNSLAAGLIEIEPRPADESYASTSVDLRLGSVLRIVKDRTIGVESAIDPTTPGYNVVKSIERETTKQLLQKMVLLLKAVSLSWVGRTSQSHYLKKDDWLLGVEGKSSLARIGLAVHVTAPTIHSGFRAPSIQLEIINHGPLPIKLRNNMPICQLIFEKTLGMPDKAYQGQFLGQTP